MTRTWMALGLLGFVAGCSGAIAPPIGGDGGADGATSDSGPDVATTCPSTTLGQSIYGACIDSIHVVEEQGGFGPPPPQGSECSYPGSVYDLKMATGGETSDVCMDPGGQQPYTRIQGTRTLLPAQLADVVAALKNVRVVSSNGCMADGPTLTLTVGAQGVDTVFGDSKVSACAGTPVDGIAAVLATLRVK